MLCRLLHDISYSSIELLKFTKLKTPLLRLVITAEHFAVSALKFWILEFDDVT